ncbi:MAG TPA: YdeI/OmpD-associated family protein [Bacteroidia bacterium]|nr:YdeI/OmpD-associated family protein [Bacteroidia bacterium]
MTTEPKITFFKTQADFRKWLEKNHEKKTELFVGFYKKNSGIKSITWPESVDEALCFGWIDGLRKNIDEKSYFIRFTPRKKTSIWSHVNIEKIAKLTKEGLMFPAGIKAFEHRKDHKSGIYSFEQRKEIELSPAYLKKFKANKKAWSWFSKSPKSYSSAVIWRIMSAKQEATRIKRLETLISSSEKGEKIPELRWGEKKT